MADGMLQPRAGYRFIPLNSKVCPSPLYFATKEARDQPTAEGKQQGQPEPKAKISLGQPLKDGYSGVIKVTWKAETPLCVGQRDKTHQVDDDEQAAVTRPFKLGKDYAIPGASLKGMLRSVLEILTFSHLGQINDHHRFGYRDYRMNEYTSRVISNDIKAGWLVFDEPQATWWLAPARGTRGFHYLPIDLLEQIPGFSGWKTKSIAEKRRLILQKVRSEAICFKPVYEGKSVIDSFSNKQQTGWSIGYFAFSDKVNPRSNKKYETVIEHPINQAHWLKLDDDFMRQFSFINSKAVRDRIEAEGSWLYWLKSTGWPEPTTGHTYDDKNRQESKLPGIPVFYCGTPGSGPEDEGMPFNIGLSRVIKIGYDQSVGQVAARTLGAKDDEGYAIPRLGSSELDFARAILGDVEDTHEGRKSDKKISRDALKGRVAFGFAWANNHPEELAVPPTVLMGPRASFWPFYLCDAKDRSRSVSYNSPFAELAGRKRYPVRHEVGIMPPPPKRQDGTVNLEVASKVSFLNAGAVFEGEIRFHNLHQLELGALLCALSLGQKDSPTRHSLGHAKAFGYGSLSCEFKMQACPNIAQDEVPSEADFIAMFRAHMDGWFREQHLGGEWVNSPQIQSLLKMSYPIQNPNLTQRLGSIGEVKDFAGFKKGPRPTALPDYSLEFDQMEQPRPELNLLGVTK